MKVYWELSFGTKDDVAVRWVGSGNSEICNRAEFDTVTDAVMAFRRGGDMGLRYRLVREDGKPLLTADGGCVYPWGVR